jgi:hypothetical protein
MARIHIPFRVFPGFIILSKLKEKKVNEIVDFMNKMPIGIEFYEAAEGINNILETEEGYDVLDTIKSFSTLVEDEETDIANVATSLTDSFIDLSQQEMSPKQKDQLNKNLLKILSNYSILQNTLKSKELLLGNENNFIDLRSISDIRLMFNEDLSVKNRMGMILHKLLIDYRRNDESKEIHLTLNLEDLHRVKSEVERAILKEELIRKDYKSSINFIG